MLDPIRLLHFSDIHIGMENYGKLDPQTGVSSRIGDFLARLDEIVQYALDHDADLVVFAGDAFKTRDPDPTQQREFARRLKQLASRMPVFLLVGNHDIPGIAARATSVDIFRALEMKPLPAPCQPLPETGGASGATHSPACTGDTCTTVLRGETSQRKRSIWLSSPNWPASGPPAQTRGIRSRCAATLGPTGWAEARVLAAKSFSMLVVEADPS